MVGKVGVCRPIPYPRLRDFNPAQHREVENLPTWSTFATRLCGLDGPGAIFAPKFRRFELDPSWLVIRVLAALRQIVITGPPVRLPPDRGVLR
jgi:hypothetical protein